MTDTRRHWLAAMTLTGVVLAAIGMDTRPVMEWTGGAIILASVLLQLAFDRDDEAARDAKARGGEDGKR